MKPQSRQKTRSPPGSSHHRESGWSVEGGLSHHPRPRTVLGQSEVGVREFRVKHLSQAKLPNLHVARQAVANEAIRSFDHPRKVEYAKQRTSRGSSPDSYSQSASSPNAGNSRRSSVTAASPKLAAGDPNWLNRQGSFRRLDRAGNEYHVHSKDSRIWAYPGRVHEAQRAGMDPTGQPWADGEERQTVVWQPSTSTLGSSGVEEQERVWQWLNGEPVPGRVDSPSYSDQKTADARMAARRKRMRTLMQETQANVAGAWSRLKGFIALSEREGESAGIPFTEQLREARSCLDSGVIGKPLFEKIKVRVLRGSSTQDKAKEESSQGVPWCLDGVDAERWAASTSVSHPSFSSLETSIAINTVPAGKSWRQPPPAISLIQSGRLRPSSKPENAAWATPHDTQVYKPRRQSQVTVVHYDDYHGQEKMSQTRTASPSSDRSTGPQRRLPPGVDLAFTKSLYSTLADKEKKDWLWDAEHGKWADKNWMNATNMIKKVKNDELWEQYMYKPGRKLH